MPKQRENIKYLEGWNVPLTIWWDADKRIVRLIDQTLLPDEVIVVECQEWQDIREAIRSMRIRGAPAIGVAGAYALALEAQRFQGNPEEFFGRMKEVKRKIIKVRPTAANLKWGAKQVYDSLVESGVLEPEKLKEIALIEAEKIMRDDIKNNMLIGKFGSEILEKKRILSEDALKLLTHCNAGSLATGGYGTALGVIRSVASKGIGVHVFACETRPLLQGARITAWELLRDNIPVTLITDNSAGWIMKKEKISAVVVGADRIAANGDTANKIGTYSLSILAREHGIPFYIAAPTSTIDDNTESGNEIEIERRSYSEVTCVRGVRIAPHLSGDQVRNDAFDITPHEYIAGIITELGVIQEPYKEKIGQLKRKNTERIPR